MANPDSIDEAVEIAAFYCVDNFDECVSDAADCDFAESIKGALMLALIGGALDRHASAAPGRRGMTTSKLESLYGWDKRFLPVSGKGEIEQVLQAGGNGARGIVLGLGRKTGQGEVGRNHVFNAVNDGGTIRFIDTQNGVTGSFDGYTSIRFLRTG